MNKRSAMLVAAGLVLTLVVGGVAVAVGMTGPSASSAQPKLTHHKNKPIIKTTKKTVTVHKKAKAQPGAVVTVPGTYSGTTSSSSGSSSSYDDSSSSGTSYGDDSSSDDSSESEDPGSTDDGSTGGGGSGVEDD